MPRAKPRIEITPSMQKALKVQQARHVNSEELPGNASRPCSGYMKRKSTADRLSRIIRDIEEYAEPDAQAVAPHSVAARMRRRWPTVPRPFVWLTDDYQASGTEHSRPGSTPKPSQSSCFPRRVSTSTIIRRLISAVSGASPSNIARRLVSYTQGFSSKSMRLASARTLLFLITSGPISGGMSR